MPSRSSRSWKAMPRARPKRASCGLQFGSSPGTPRHAPNSVAAGHQRRGFATNHVQVHRLGDVSPALVAHIQELALAEFHTDLVEQLRPGESLPAPAMPRIGQLPESHASQSEETISGIDGLRNAPQLPHCGSMPPLFIAIFDVVVYQREVVHQLNAGRRGTNTLPADPDARPGPRPMWPAARSARDQDQ